MKRIALLISEFPIGVDLNDLSKSSWEERRMKNLYPDIPIMPTDYTAEIIEQSAEAAIKDVLNDFDQHNKGCGMVWYTRTLCPA